LATKQLQGHKQNKECLTLAVCCNADGLDKLPLLVIGKYENPRCFKNVNRDNFGCKYRSNSKAWMTQVIFLEWLKRFDARMAGHNVLFYYGQLQRTYPINAACICCYTLQHNRVLSATKHNLEDSALRRRNYQEPQGLLSAPFQLPLHLAPSGQGSKPRED
jgi:hypothetical protein